MATGTSLASQTSTTVRSKDSRQSLLRVTFRMLDVVAPPLSVRLAARL